MFEEVLYMAGLPRDPMILFSVVNTKLRDFYPSLEALCEDMDEDAAQIVEILERAGFRYDPQRNAFV